MTKSKRTANKWRGALAGLALLACQSAATAGVQVDGHAGDLTVRATDATVAEVLQAVAETIALDVHMQARLEQRVSVEYVDRDLRHILRRLLKSSSYVLFETQAGERYRLAILAPSGQHVGPLVISGKRAERDADLLYRDLSDADPKLRGQGVQMLVETDDANAWGAAAGALVDADPGVRVEAIYAMAALDAAAAVTELHAALSDPSARVRAAAIESLAETGAVAPLRDAFASLAPGEQIAVIDALGDLDNAQAAAFLRDAAENDNTAIAAAAAEYLSERAH